MSKALTRTALALLGALCVVAAEVDGCGEPDTLQARAEGRA